MTANVLPFPAARRIGHVRRIAGIMAGSDPRWCEAYLRQQLKILADRLRTATVNEIRVANEVTSFEHAIRAELSLRRRSPQGAA
jgi:hypothetical protein